MALADIDGDGWVDLYVANYRSSTFRDEPDKKYRVATANNRYELLAVDGRPVTAPDLVGRFTVDRQTGVLEHGEADVLYQNDRGRFIPVRWSGTTFLDGQGKAAGTPYDWGLSVMFRDLNGDRAPDLYVCNDFQSEDRIWINDGHGRFRPAPPLAFRHTSLFSMGVDFADLDRDGFDEIFVADMLSREHIKRQVQLSDRKMSPPPAGDVHYRPQYPQNTLFWNRGDGTYAEAAQASGVAASDWSWCPAFIDGDLDGFEDLLITTGHVRDAQNVDISRRIDLLKRQKQMSWREQLELRKMFPRLETANYAFRNRGDRTFVETGQTWGFDSRRISHGMALADLDGDGDLDVIVNCLNDAPLIYRNNCVRPRLAVRLRGLAPNSQGIGARITVSGGAVPRQSQEMISGGRYLSGDEALRTFAAGNNDAQLGIEILWRSGRKTVIQRAQADRIYEIQEPAETPSSLPPKPEPVPLFRDLSDLISHVHRDEPFDDFHRQPLLAKKLSQLGPGICWFDMDRDGWEDLIVGSGRGGTPGVFRNDGKGSFNSISPASLRETSACDQTAVVAARFTEGRSTVLIGLAHYEDRTNGSSVARIEWDSQTQHDLLSHSMASSGPLALADADADGDLDLFVGGRVVPGRFPEPASSCFFFYEDGVFHRDSSANSALEKVGLVSGAIWSDLTGDGLPELVLACDAGPIKVFSCRAGRVEELTKKLGLARYAGWWNSVASGDFDGDGRLDLVAGGFGRNTKYEACGSESTHLFYGDLNADGWVELVEGYSDAALKKIVPFRDWGSLGSVFPAIQERYPDFTAFSAAGVNEFLAGDFARMQETRLTTFDSMVLLNRGDHFEARALPFEAQVSPVFGIVVADFDGDGDEDLFMSQNFSQVSWDVARLDAGRGLLLRGDGRGSFRAMPARESGLRVDGDGRGAAACDYDHDGRLDLVVGQNANMTKLYRNERGRSGLRIYLEGTPRNPDAIGAVLWLGYGEGRNGPAHEIRAGSGYWSQDSPIAVLGMRAAPATLSIRWPGGRETTVPWPKNSRSLRVSVDGGVTSHSKP